LVSAPERSLIGIGTRNSIRRDGELIRCPRRVVDSATVHVDSVVARSLPTVEQLALVATESSGAAAVASVVGGAVAQVPEVTEGLGAHETRGRRRLRRHLTTLTTIYWFSFAVDCGWPIAGSRVRIEVQASVALLFHHVVVPAIVVPIAVGEMRECASSSATAGTGVF